MKILPIVYGRSTLPESMAFAGGDGGRSLPIDFILYYVETAGRRILVDAGCDTMPGFVMQDFIGPVRALEAAGISPESITDVVITHAHHDHMEGVRHFPRATVHIQREEYEAGRRYLPNALSVRLFEEEHALCDGVRVLKIGGHTRGSSIVELWDGETRFVVCGDECYVRRCLTDKIPTGTSVSPEKSRAFVEKYSDPRYVTLLCHEA